MTLSDYLKNLNNRFKSGISTEHSYRGDLQQLIESLAPGVMATNEPTRFACGAPDYILTKGGLPVGYIEAKDIGKDLSAKEHKEQFDRYRKSLPNLIITDYLEFRFFREGELAHTVRIGEIQGKRIIPFPEQFKRFYDLIIEFTTHYGKTVRSSVKLAKMMAGKAKLMADIIRKAIESDEKEIGGLFQEQNRTLQEQYQAFKNVLIHDIKPEEFADIFSQTIAYGMFAARLNDHTMDNFSRQEAAELIPKTNPFLRKLFQYVAGYDLDDRIKWLVDDLADIFRATDIRELLKDFGKATQQTDPIIHFYEDFLAEYDPKLRKSRGVWYTPEPVVKFIVRAVDDILKQEFGLAEGLADTSKIKTKVKIPTHDKRFKAKQKDYEQEVHRVQILDPACGTGTFLAEVVRHIHQSFEGQQGLWSQYVEDHLIPRLNGFELLMASYAMAHLKLSLLLEESGYKPQREQRFRVYLTNSLEEHHQDTGTLFANWLSTEANEANHIKRDTPVMCVIGNPPYSGISSNNGKWISDLIEDYKYVDGVHFNERKHWLNDDYVKFIRYGQHFIEKNGSGVLAFINPHGFIDNPTFKGMRWHLLRTYDKIYVLDLHGNSKKKECAPDGSADINVFDIQQGVSINIFVKTGKKRANDLGEVFHCDFYGKRELKYHFLSNSSLHNVQFKKLEYSSPYFFFVPKDDSQKQSYLKGFSINEIFLSRSAGFVSANDFLNISFTKKEQQVKIEELLCLEEANWRQKYKRLKDARDWTYDTARNDAERVSEDMFQEVTYRPFDYRWSCYSGNSRGLYSSPQPEIMRYLSDTNNALILPKQVPDKEAASCFISKFKAGHKSCSAYNTNSLFPLYAYPESNAQQTIDQQQRTPNLNAKILKQIAENIGLTFTNEKEVPENTFAPIDILDYIYAVLHSPTYRERYKEFLKIDFPRVPYPKDKEVFWQLVKLGGELRQIHLLESPRVEQFITQYPVTGENILQKPKYKEEKVWINESQYFQGVPELAWNFYIGGYQPAQKWLKDRVGRSLTYEDIRHYQKIIVALVETDRIMKEIDKIDFLD